MKRILLVDDHDMVRKRIRQVIQKWKNWKVCGEAADGREAIHKHSVLKPHVVVMDFKMPRLDGLQAARRILKQDPSASILMLSVSSSQQLMDEVKRWGYEDSVPKAAWTPYSRLWKPFFVAKLTFPSSKPKGNGVY